MPKSPIFSFKYIISILHLENKSNSARSWQSSHSGPFSTERLKKLDRVRKDGNLLRDQESFMVIIKPSKDALNGIDACLRDPNGFYRRSHDISLKNSLAMAAGTNVRIKTGKGDLRISSVIFCESTGKKIRDRSVSREREEKKICEERAR